MKRKQEVLMSIEKQYDDFMVTWAVQKELCLGVHKMAAEDVIVLVKAAKKFYKLVEV